MYLDACASAPCQGMRDQVDLSHPGVGTFDPPDTSICSAYAHQVTHTLEVSNHGPDHADGAVVTDPGVPDGLDCTALACSASSGAACPATPAPAQLAAGLAIPTCPSGGAVTLGLTCTVTATGVS